jgi:hypothetical protein
MFDEIKTALAKTNNQGNTKYRDILKLEVGNIYTVRLVPNIEDPSMTFFRYFSHAWESFSTGQYLSNVSPQTWGEKDPISEAKYSLLKHGSDEEKEKAAKIMRRENWLANVFVVNDPTNPDNNGKVKLLRFGKQIHKIIMEAIEGDDSDEFGAKIFDMSPNGCSFKIKVERQGDFPTYVSSRFAGPSKVKNLPEGGVEEVYSTVSELETVFTVKGYDELKQVLDEHFYCKDTSTDSVWNSEGGTTPAPTAASPPSTPSTPSTDSIDPLNDDKVKQLLDGLGD